MDMDRDDARRLGPDDDDPIEFSWKDVLAFTIAAYQLLLPVVAALIGVAVLIYLLFAWWAS